MSQKEEEWTKLTIRVPVDWLWQTKAFAVANRTTVSAIVAQAVTEKMDRDGFQAGTLADEAD